MGAEQRREGLAATGAYRVKEIAVQKGKNTMDLGRPFLSEGEKTGAQKLALGNFGQRPRGTNEDW